MAISSALLELHVTLRSEEMRTGCRPSVWFLDHEEYWRVAREIDAIPKMGEGEPSAGLPRLYAFEGTMLVTEGRPPHG